MMTGPGAPRPSLHPDTVARYLARDGVEEATRLGSDEAMASIMALASCSEGRFSGSQEVWTMPGRNLPDGPWNGSPRTWKPIRDMARADVPEGSRVITMYGLLALRCVVDDDTVLSVSRRFGDHPLFGEMFRATTRELMQGQGLVRYRHTTLTGEHDFRFLTALQYIERAAVETKKFWAACNELTVLPPVIGEAAFAALVGTLPPGPTDYPGRAA